MNKRMVLHPHWLQGCGDPIDATSTLFDLPLPRTPFVSRESTDVPRPSEVASDRAILSTVQFCRQESERVRDNRKKKDRKHERVETDVGVARWTRYDREEEHERDQGGGVRVEKREGKRERARPALRSASRTVQWSLRWPCRPLWVEIAAQTQNVIDFSM